MSIKPENFKFVQNRKCEFFPCHKIDNEDEFNCLFCFCPLYMLKNECGGNFKDKNGIKDCSDCVLPHTSGGYDFVMSKMDTVVDIASQNIKN